MDNKNKSELEFSGEFFIPGKSGERSEQDHLERYKFAAKYVNHKRVLDIACGVGYSAPLFIQAGAFEYTGVDIKEELIHYANQKYSTNRIKFETGNICSFTNQNQFDLITCFETIEHLDDYKLALKNLYKLLSSKGILFISSPNRVITSPKAKTLHDKPANEFHIHEFKPEELSDELIKVGFKLESNSFFGQRQRIFYCLDIFNKIRYKVLGDPDIYTSPVVTPLKKTPRFFIITAKK